MNVQLEKYTEVFETNNINNELVFIKEYIEKIKNRKEINHISNQSALSMEILRLQNDNLAKQIELEHIKLKSKELDVKIAELNSKKQNGQDFGSNQLLH